MSRTLRRRSRQCRSISGRWKTTRKLWRRRGMQPAIPEFMVGDLRCRILCDGELAYPEEMLSRGLSGADRARSSGVYSSADGRVKVPYTALLVDAPCERILLDTGAGQLGPGTGRLPSLLESAGIAPKSIHAVLLTHGHPDLGYHCPSPGLGRIESHGSAWQWVPVAA